jgi:hypothetical protein
VFDAYQTRYARHGIADGLTDPSSAMRAQIASCS